jgi:tetratricopeptide (TPR) repeat protein
LNYKVNALNVTGYHVFNIMIHLMNAILIYWLVILTFRTPYFSDYLQRDIFGSSDTIRWIALFTAFLFVAHPVQTQAVTYIVQRFTSLATLFYLLAIVMYIKARNSGSRQAQYSFYAVAIISTILAMRTKEIAFTLPAMIILYEFMFFKGETKRRLLYLTPFLLTMPIIPLTLMGLKSFPAGFSGVDELTRIAGVESVSRWDYLITEFRVIVTYIRLLFFPINQNLDYDYPIYRTFLNPEVLLSFLFLLALFGLGAYLFYVSTRTEKGNRLWLRMVSFGIFWFFVTLSVESSIIPIVDVIYEHRLYLPSVGFFLAFMSGMVFIREKFAPRTKVVEKVFIPVMILVVVSLSMTAYARNTVWQDEIALWEDVLKKSPYKARPNWNLGVFYVNQGFMDKALYMYQAAIRRKPDYVEAHNNLGLVYLKQGRLDEALQAIQTALKYKPDYAEAHNNLGLVFYDQGRLDDAIRKYLEALKYKPDYAEAHNNIGLVYLKENRLNEAIKEYETSLKIKPNYADAYYNLATIYIRMRKLNEAIELLQKAVVYKPFHVHAHHDLGVIFAIQKRYEEAYREFQAVLHINPDHKNARNNLNALSRAMKEKRN